MAIFLFRCEVSGVLFELRSARVGLSPPAVARAPSDGDLKNKQERKVINDITFYIIFLDADNGRVII